MAIDERDRRTRTPVAARTHRVHCFAGRVHDALDDIVGADGSAFVALSELGVAATRETIVELARLQDRIEALKAEVPAKRPRLVQVLSRPRARTSDGWPAGARGASGDEAVRRRPGPPHPPGDG